MSPQSFAIAARKKSPVRKSAAAAVPTFSDESESDSDDSAADADYGARPDKAGKAYVPSDDEHGQGEVLPRTTSFVNNDQQRKPKKKKEVREKKERKKREPREPRERRESASPEPEEVLDEATSESWCFRDCARKSRSDQRGYWSRIYQSTRSFFCIGISTPKSH